MALIKLFQTTTIHPEEKNERDSALSLLETQMGVAILRKKVLSVSGPHANVVEINRTPTLIYTASVVYEG